MAYAIALAGLISSFGAGNAAAQMAGGSGNILCHSAVAGGPTSPADQSDGKACPQCCTGCLTPLVALPPPPAIAATAQAKSHRVVPPKIAALSGAFTDKSHRARAPPQVG